MLFAPPSTSTADYKDSFTTFFTEFVAHGSVGLIVGAFVDRTFALVTRLSKRHLTDREDGLVLRGLALALAIAQLLTSILLLFVLMLALPSHVYKRWQSTVPGLAFPSLFFGIQTQLFENVRTVVNVENVENVVNV